MATPPLTPVQLLHFDDDAPAGLTRADQVVTEEPLEIRINGQPFQVTLRTPGADRALVAGLLFAEGIIRDAGDLISIEPITDPDAADLGNVINATLAPTAPGVNALHARTGVVSAACGLCGKTFLDALAIDLPPIVDPFTVTWDLITGLPDKLRERQTLFELTGGIHAAGLFTIDGALLALAEDVGRHNAVDKVIGQLVLEGLTALPGTILQISGRPGYEILQKAWRAQIPMIAAVGAPSSLAVDLAARAGITLVAFLRGSRGNVYTGAKRLSEPGA